MALLPYLVDTLVDDLEPLYYHPRSLNRYVTPSMLGLTTPLNTGYLRTLRHLQPDDSGISSVEDTKEAVQISLDVKDFKPEEIKVKVTDDFVIVEGKHEERKDEHSFVSRQFTRKYRLPPNVNSEAISSNLSTDHVLQIIAPKKVEDPKKSNAREIKVTQTNKPAVTDPKAAVKDAKAAAGNQAQEKMET